ncbi:DUF2798 domain-containing protein [Pseudoalteromonas sp. S16_S37]|uniref:DUF2798 domain-containing protein n=1 Tax=Pseudoalteromonas sp. S16_S37 TaxID=2720228 RepID=UPI00167FE739|nr:DUF2798 domain-containing protein [Pseudoalteromonas sp. S16_S37]MBD1583863.1 DUF2798 domain-containing protein [Pseudoalteromonas sp. S16_S37]
MKLLKKILVMVPVVFTLVGILTFVMTYKNIGLSDGFVAQWLTSTLWAATTMAPIGFVMAALISKVVAVLQPKARDAIKNTVIGISMAVIMEGFMAAVTTINNVPYKSMATFVVYWWQAFILALPVGLLISVFMTLTVKPRLERFMAS